MAWYVEEKPRHTTEPIKNAVKPATSSMSGPRTTRPVTLELMEDETEEDEKSESARPSSPCEAAGACCERIWWVEDGYEAEARRRTLPVTVVKVRLEG